MERGTIEYAHFLLQYMVEDSLNVKQEKKDESISTDREHKIGVNRHGGDVIGDVTEWWSSITHI